MASLMRTHWGTELEEVMEQAIWISVERVFWAKGTVGAKALW